MLWKATKNILTNLAMRNAAVKLFTCTDAIPATQLSQHIENDVYNSSRGHFCQKCFFVYHYLS